MEIYLYGKTIEQILAMQERDRAAYSGAIANAETGEEREGLIADWNSQKEECKAAIEEVRNRPHKRPDTPTLKSERQSDKCECGHCRMVHLSRCRVKDCKCEGFTKERSK